MGVVEGNRGRCSPGRQNDNVQTDQGYRGPSQRKINEPGYLTIGSGSGRISSTQAGGVPEDESFDGAPADGGVSVEKDAMKSHVPIPEELNTGIDCALQTGSTFSNFKTPPTDYVTDNSVIPAELVEVVVVDEDTITLNHDFMGKQGAPIFEGSDFMVGWGNVKGNKTTGKVRAKRNGNMDKCVSQPLHNPKRVGSGEKSTIGSPKAMMNWKRLGTRPQTLINSSIVDLELGHKRKQAENMNKEHTIVKGKKKKRIMENEQGVVSIRGSMVVAGQPCRV